jgi:hypothetical protein
MPRKDGQPTALERKDAARRKANRDYVADGKDLSHFSDRTLTQVRDECPEDALVCALIDAELQRRADA